MRNKFLALMLALCALITLCACDSRKGDDTEKNTEKVFEDENFVYEIKDESVIVYAYKGKGENVKIPSTFDGKTVTKIDESAFEGRDFIKSVEIPDSIKSIGMFAFHGCTALESVKLSSSLTDIKESVFSGCVSLKSITIPSGVIYIGDCAFSDCYALESVEIPDTVETIGYGAFLQCFALKEIVIPNSVTRIEDTAFAYCKGLESIKLSENLRNIGYEVFDSCISLKNIVIPKASVNIENEIFTGCTALESIFCESDIANEYWDQNWLEGCNANVYYGDSWHYVEGVPTIK